VKFTISRDWTPEKRIRIASAMLSGIQKDIYADRYSEPGRPNITSVQGILLYPAEDLEPYRSQCEAAVEKQEQELG
jgi:hypothetical protein